MFMVRCFFSHSLELVRKILQKLKDTEETVFSWLYPTSLHSWLIYLLLLWHNVICISQYTPRVGGGRKNSQMLFTHSFCRPDVIQHLCFSSLPPTRFFSTEKSRKHLYTTEHPEAGVHYSLWVSPPCVFVAFAMSLPCKSQASQCLCG